MLEISTLRKERTRGSYSMSASDALVITHKILARQQRIDHLEESKNGMTAAQKGVVTREQNKIRKSQTALTRRLKDAPPEPIDPAVLNIRTKKWLLGMVSTFTYAVEEFVNQVIDHPSRLTGKLEYEAENLVKMNWTERKAQHILNYIDELVEEGNAVNVHTHVHWFTCSIRALEGIYKSLVRDQLQIHAPNIRSTSMMCNTLELYEHYARARFIETLEYRLCALSDRWHNVMSWTELTPAERSEL